MPLLSPINTQCLLLLWINIACYADRTNIAIALLYTNTNTLLESYALAAFFIGYLLTQIPAAIAAKRYSPKLTLLVGVSIWTAANLSTIPAISHTNALIAARCVMGLGEGANFPALHYIASNWFPEHSKTFLTSIIASGQDIGTVCAMIISPYIAKHAGWEFIFIAFAAFNAAWIIAFSFLGKSKPDKHTLLLLNGRSKDQVPWKRLITNKACLAIFAAHSCFNYGWYMLLSWLPKYLKSVYQVDLSQKPLGAVPYIVGFIGATASSRTCDYLINKKGISKLFLRRLMNTVGLVGPAICLALITFTSGLNWCIFTLCTALFFGRFVVSGYWVNMLDVAPEYAGELMGISNTIATLPGILCNYLTGYILDEYNSWFMVFIISSGVNIIGALIYVCLSSVDTEISSSEN
jgi:ACS family sodium-dependent inorganic phosphate cotransporter